MLKKPNHWTTIGPDKLPITVDATKNIATLQLYEDPTIKLQYNFHGGDVMPQSVDVYVINKTGSHAKGFTSLEEAKPIVAKIKQLRLKQLQKFRWEMILLTTKPQELEKRHVTCPFCSHIHKDITIAIGEENCLYLVRLKKCRKCGAKFFFDYIPMRVQRETMHFQNPDRYKDVLELDVKLISGKYLLASQKD
jgi:hypothetical protein